MIDSELRELRRDLKVTRKAAFAAGTHTNHLAQWRTYLLFCLYFSFDFLSATVDTVCLFSQFLSRSLTPASVRNYLRWFKFLDVPLGHDFPLLRTFSIRITLRGMDRMALHFPMRAPPVTPSILFSLIQLSCRVDSSPEYITFLCAFFLMGRISNIVPLCTRSFDCRKHLCRGDIVSAPHGLTVAFKWSKTNQTGIRHLLLPLVAMPNSPLCPVKMFHRMCALTPASPMSPAYVLSPPDSSLSPVIKCQFV